jgi:hypothetical protein
MNPVCPYCNTEIEETDPNKTACPTCGAAHHGECWQENGGCTVFGCASAPEEEPKITVGAAELAAIAPPPPGYRAALPPPPQARMDLEPVLSLGGYNVPPPVLNYSVPIYEEPPKNRIAYILLGFFLGSFGAHNFYAGYTSRGIAQLCITVCTLFFGAIVSWGWAVFEICTVERDSRDVYMV